MSELTGGIPFHNVFSHHAFLVLNTITLSFSNYWLYSERLVIGKMGLEVAGFFHLLLLSNSKHFLDITMLKGTMEAHIALNIA